MPAALDQAKLADLTKKVAANPKDVASLQSIADLYFNANDWTNAKAVRPEGARRRREERAGPRQPRSRRLQRGDNATAEKTWKAGIALHPENAELRYDLGFLYMTTGRMDLMKTEWAKVVEIDPEQRAGQDRPVPGRRRHQDVRDAHQ